MQVKVKDVMAPDVETVRPDIAQRAPRRLTAELVAALSRETPLSVTVNPAAGLK